MIRLIKKKYVRAIEWNFKIAYLLLCLSTFNTFLYDSPVQPALVKICLILGGIALLGRVLFFKDYVRMPYWIVLTLFCGSFLVTIFSNRSYGKVTEDLKWLIWTALAFFLLYVCDMTKSREAYKKEFIVLAHIMIVYGTIATAVGIYLLQNFYQKTWYTGNGEKMFVGFFWGRLWGIYTDPNYGAVFSVAVIYLCIYFCVKVKSWRKVFYIIAAFMNYLYMAFSDSRTAEVCMVSGAIFCILYTCVCRFRKRKGFIVGFLISLIFAAAFMGGTSYLKSQVNTKVQKEIVKQNLSQSKGKVNKNKNIKKGQLTGRKADIQKDVSSGRLALWHSGIEVWKTKPVLGTGYNSFLPYVEKNLPTTYAVNNAQDKYVSLHNAYLNILVYQGALGAVILFMFLMLVLKELYKGIMMGGNTDHAYMAALMAGILIIGISMMFLLEGVYTNSPGVFILWTFLGYLMHDITIRKGLEK